MNFKIKYDKNTELEAMKNQSKATTKLGRLLEIIIAEIKCNIYLFYRLFTTYNGECMFVTYNHDNKRNMIGTVTGSLFKDGYTMKRIFWCDDKNYS